MRLKIWRNAAGKLLRNLAGAKYICEECPCVTPGTGTGTLPPPPDPVSCLAAARDDLAGVLAIRFRANDIEVEWPLFYQTDGIYAGGWRLENDPSYPGYIIDETYGLFVWGDENEGVSICDVRLVCCDDRFEVNIQYCIWKAVPIPDEDPQIQNVGGCQAAYTSANFAIPCTDDIDDIVPSPAVIDWIMYQNDPLWLEMTANSWADRAGNWNTTYADDVMNNAGFIEDTTFTLQILESLATDP